MKHDYEKLDESKKILYKIAHGIDPITNAPIKNESFINDPRVIRSLFFLVDYIDAELAKIPRSKKGDFFITKEQKSHVKFPSGEIGINDCAKAINDVIDIRLVKRISGTMINKQLKKMGILNEVKTEDGKIRTITNEKSEGYGIISRIRFFDNRQYEQVLFNDLGKKFLIENLEKILNY
ncbi:hypothetical protein ACIQXV_20055 [Neobacillus sp. NPDC097160]|uniref:hypothetical protein n=1 Tax=Neobacillus sp. NPDC097160 TaxID=3364298 RepID=UPI00380784F3